MKNFAKVFLIFTILFFTMQPSYAKIYEAKALSDFNTEYPAENFVFQILEDVELDNIIFPANSTFVAVPYKIKEQRRLKRNAVLVMRISSFIKPNNVTVVTQNLFVKYATELDKMETSKSVALTAANFFVKGISIGYRVVEGAVKNEEDNRFISGAKAAYDSSPFSYVEKGEPIVIKTGDTIYFNFHIINPNDLSFKDIFIYSIEDSEVNE